MDRYTIKTDTIGYYSLFYFTSLKNYDIETIHTHTQIYIKVKLLTVVEDDPKAPFSISPTPRCRRGHYSFPCIAPLYP